MNLKSTLNLLYSDNFLYLAAGGFTGAKEKAPAGDTGRDFFASNHVVLTKTYSKSLGNSVIKVSPHNGRCQGYTRAKNRHPERMFIINIGHCLIDDRR